MLNSKKEIRKDYHKFLDHILNAYRNKELIKYSSKKISKSIAEKNYDNSDEITAIENANTHKMLLEDGYLVKNQQDGSIMLSIKGHLFIQDGGYTKQAKRQKNIDLVYFLAQWCVIIAGIYYFLEIIKELPIIFINYCK